MKWYRVSEKEIPFGEEVIAFNEKWIDEDFNPNGTRVGFIQDDGFVSATWNIKLEANNATNEKQLNRLLALNKLLNIAEYYNEKSPKEGEYIYCISLDGRNFEYFAQRSRKPRIERGLIPEFNREEDAKAVINNPNFKWMLDLIYKDDEN